MKKFVFGLCVGIGAGIAGREVAPTIRRIGKPFTKAALKVTLQALERGIEAASHLGESLDDLIAEAKAEIEEPTPKPQDKRKRSPARRTRKKTESSPHVANSDS